MSICNFDLMDDLSALFGSRALQQWDLNYMKAMAQGSEASQEVYIAFDEGGTCVVNAAVVIGASPYDIRPFVVEETLDRYLRFVGELSYDTIRIKIGENGEDESFDPDFFDGTCELHRLSKEARKIYGNPVELIALYVQCRQALFDAFPKYSQDLKSAEARSFARREFKKLHAAYLYMTYGVQGGDKNHLQISHSPKQAGRDFRQALRDRGFTPHG